MQQDQKPQITFGKFANVDMRVAKVLEAPLAEGTRNPCRVFKLDLGPLGTRSSVGQYALIDESELVGSNVVTCINLGTRDMGGYASEALVLGVPHPDSPSDEAQAMPLRASERAQPGDPVF